jgi:recombination protein RecT
MSDQPSTAVAKADENPIVAYFNKKGNLAKLAEALPAEVNLTAFKRCLFTQFQHTPRLMECSIASVWDSAMRSAQCGLPPDGVHAHLVPYKGKCTFIPDRKGLVQLFYRGCGGIVESSLVCEGDIFESNRGRVVKHVRCDLNPDAEKRTEAGNCYAVYTVLTMPNGLEKHEIMTVGEIEAVMKRSPARDDGPWVTDWGEMAKKTVEKRAYKTAPRSAQLSAAIEADRETNGDDDNQAPATRTGPTVAGETLDVGEAPPKT